MILAIDVGNTNIVIGGLSGEEIFFTARISTDKSKTADDYAAKLKNLLEIYHINCNRIEGSILSTVVPALATILSDAVEKIIGIRPLVVSSEMDTGVHLQMDNPKQTGADLLVDAAAVLHEYPQPTLFFDMGTATTVSAIDEHGDYIGGMIIAGAELSLEALSSGTAQLPHISMDAPEKMLGKNTIDCMKSGVIYGTAAMVDGIIQRAEEEMGQKLTVVATGGIAKAIVPHCKRSIICDSNLTLKGLRILYERNC
ncbi:MAG: type III pantothenate kinase [Oscillospiraceae bacterium]|nr:type III pantothenate kinase [Oscillospiraceae bacterium]